MGLAANLCHLPSNSFLQSLGGSCSQEGRGALLRPGGAGLSAGFVPRLPRPFVWLPRCDAHGLLSNSGGSGGHVSGSRQLRGEGCVTIETAANGRPALPAGAEPSAAGAGGWGGAEASKKLRAGPGVTGAPLGSLPGVPGCSGRYLYCAALVAS